MVKDVFKNEGNAWGVASWAELSPMRQAIRGAADSGRAAHPILKWTGALQRAATATEPYTEVDTGRTTTKAAESATPISYLVQETDKQLFLGMVGPKAVHQEGGTVGKYVIPAREFWPWGTQTEDEIIRVWSMYIMVDVFK
jgi:hypothetical protein